MTPAFVKAIAVVAVAWIAAMAVVALVVGGAVALASEGWRLTMLEAASILGFLVMSIVGGGFAVALEARRRR